MYPNKSMDDYPYCFWKNLPSKLVLRCRDYAYEIVRLKHFKNGRFKYICYQPEKGSMWIAFWLNNRAVEGKEPFIKDKKGWFYVFLVRVQKNGLIVLSKHTKRRVKWKAIDCAHKWLCQKSGIPFESIHKKKNMEDYVADELRDRGKDWANLKWGERSLQCPNCDANLSLRVDYNKTVTCGDCGVSFMPNQLGDLVD